MIKNDSVQYYVLVLVYEKYVNAAWGYYLIYSMKIFFILLCDFYYTTGFSVSWVFFWGGGVNIFSLTSTSLIHLYICYVRYAYRRGTTPLPFELGRKLTLYLSHFIHFQV